MGSDYEKWDREQNFKILAALLEKIKEKDLKKIFERDYTPMFDNLGPGKRKFIAEKIDINKIPKLKRIFFLEGEASFQDLLKTISNPKEKLWIREKALKIFTNARMFPLSTSLGDLNLEILNLERLNEELCKEIPLPKSLIEKSEERVWILKVKRLEKMNQDDLINELVFLKNHTNEQVMNEIKSRIDRDTFYSYDCYDELNKK